MNPKHIIFLGLLTSALWLNSTAQVKIGDSATNINSNSVLELESTNKGMVPPRVALVNIHQPDPLTSTLLSGTLVFNTNNQVIDGVGKGLYIWEDNQWKSPGLTSWNTNGNTGAGSSNALGTKDSTALNFLVFNQNAGSIHPGGSTFLGYNAGSVNTHLTNTGIGFKSLQSNISGNNNTAVGYYSLPSNTGNGNTGVGKNALLNNTTGSNNTALGYNANVGSVSLVNATAIGYNAVVNASNSLVLGGTGANTVNVGINTEIPAAKLDVNGNFKLGTLGTAHTSIIKASATVPSFTVMLNTTNVANISVSGATTGAVVFVSPRSSLPAGIAIAYSYVSSTNTITIGFINSGILSTSLGTIIFDIEIFQ